MTHTSTQTDNTWQGAVNALLAEIDQYHQEGLNLSHTLMTNVTDFGFRKVWGMSDTKELYDKCFNDAESGMTSQIVTQYVSGLAFSQQAVSTMRDVFAVAEKVLEKVAKARQSIDLLCHIAQDHGVTLDAPQTAVNGLPSWAPSWLTPAETERFKIAFLHNDESDYFRRVWQDVLHQNYVLVDWAQSGGDEPAVYGMGDIETAESVTQEIMSAKGEDFDPYDMLLVDQHHNVHYGVKVEISFVSQPSPDPQVKGQADDTDQADVDAMKVLNGCLNEMTQLSQIADVSIRTSKVATVGAYLANAQIEIGQIYLDDKHKEKRQAFYTKMNKWFSDAMQGVAPVYPEQ